MPTAPALLPAHPDAFSSFIWERQARPTMTAIAARAGGPARAVVVGTAGSGKSTLLRELHRLLSDTPSRASLLAPSTDIARVPRDLVLLVDDLHLLDAGQRGDIRVRAEDPDASLVVTSRPWPRIDELTSITRRLERTLSAVVLGHVSRSDVLTCLTGDDRAMSAACIDHLLQLTGGVSWLVSEGLALHDERDCADDRHHRALRRALEDRIQHRIDSLPADVRRQIEGLCVGRSAADLREGEADVIARGYAEGLLARNGEPVPLVRAAVQASMPLRRLIDLGGGIAVETAGAAGEGDPDYDRWIDGVSDPAVAAAFVTHADRMLEQNPRRALELYDAAVRCGASSAAVGARRAQAAWAAGSIDLAASIIDGISPADAPADGDRLADTAAAIWSLRGMLRTADAVYQSVTPSAPESLARATIAAIGIGRPIPPADEPPAPGIPSTRRGRDGPARSRPARHPAARWRGIRPRRPRPRLRDVHRGGHLRAAARASGRHRRHRRDQRRRPRDRRRRDRGRDPRGARR